MTVRKPLQRRHIEALVAIGDHGSVHSAASALNMAQPALSRILAEAEDILDGRVFERSVRGSVPTEKGKAVLAQARFTLQSIQRLENAAHASGPLVRLGCIPRAMHSVMPQLLSRMRAGSDAPPFQLQVTENGSVALFEELRQEKLDFAIMRHVSGAAGLGDDYVADKLYDERPIIVCSADNPAFGKQPMRLAQLAEQEWILPQPQSTSRQVLDKFWRDRNLPAIKSVIETRTFESNLALVAQTPFISIVPESVGRRHAELGLVKVIDVRPKLPASEVMLVYNRR